MLLSPEQGSHLKDQIYQLLGTEYMPPLTDEERNGLNGIIARDVDQFTLAAAPPETSALPIIPLAWESAARSATQTGACQFKVTVPADEVPRPGRIGASPAGPAGTEKFFYKWSKQPHADANGGTQGAQAKFSVTTPKDGSQTVLPGETWYIAFRMDGGNTGGKFVGEFSRNAPY